MQIVHRHKGMAEFCGTVCQREEECTNTDAKISKIILASVFFCGKMFNRDTLIFLVLFCQGKAYK